MDSFFEPVPVQRVHQLLDTLREDIAKVMTGTETRVALMGETQGMLNYFSHLVNVNESTYRGFNYRLHKCREAVERGDLHGTYDGVVRMVAAQERFAKPYLRAA